jgi:hypothetical protein
MDLGIDALVIGAGFAGLYQIHCLRIRLGLSTKVLEAGGEREIPAARGEAAGDFAVARGPEI